MNFLLHSNTVPPEPMHTTQCFPTPFCKNLLFSTDFFKLKQHLKQHFAILVESASVVSRSSISNQCKIVVLSSTLEVIVSFLCFGKFLRIHSENKLLKNFVRKGFFSVIQFLCWIYTIKLSSAGFTELYSEFSKYA